MISGGVEVLHVERCPSGERLDLTVAETLAAGTADRLGGLVEGAS